MGHEVHGEGQRIFILGSCVSRDAFAIPGHRFELAGYIARTSLASAFQTRPAPRDVLACVPRITSRFQKRMVETDLRKRALATLQGVRFDYLLVDLIDERFHLARFGGSHISPDVFTLSRELSNVSGWSGPSILPGTNQHLSVWKRGVGRLLRHIPPERIIVNRAFWAARLQDGRPLPNQALIRSSNAILEVMYGYLERNGVGAIIDYGQEIVADPEHRWGIAPFHYADGMYAELLEKLDAIVLACVKGNASLSHPHTANRGAP